MQTFLPVPDFAESARLLDWRRLGKQRVETWQIYQQLCRPCTADGAPADGRRAGWLRHPAVRMWRGYEPALLLYGMRICTEWTVRGYRDTLFARFAEAAHSPLVQDAVMPWWLGRATFHAAHRSQLLAKDAAWYGQWGWAEPPGALPYEWPAGQW